MYVMFRPLRLLNKRKHISYIVPCIDCIVLTMQRRSEGYDIFRIVY
jgi:hypothetical protein